MSKPAPLVPADVDISGMDGFMLNVQVLFASELWALSTGDEFKAAVALWGRAWLQTPPGSLPVDDRILAGFSGAGAKWKKVRAIALRGFIECSDGRLYHKTLCDDVLIAWKKRQDFRKRTAAATEARRQRNDQRNDDRRGDVTDSQVTLTETGDKNLYIEERLGLEGDSPADPSADPDFRRFFALYPKKTGEDDAARAFAKARLGAPIEEILAGAKTYGAERRAKGEPQFDMSPDKWLNGRRWRDHQPSEAAQAAETKVFVVDGTQQMAAWREDNGGKSFPSAKHPSDPSKTGWWMDSEWPPGREPSEQAA